ncbi:MAG: amino acid adenylation domain-containing protein [Cystobacter sp.]
MKKTALTSHFSDLVSHTPSTSDIHLLRPDETSTLRQTTHKTPNDPPRHAILPDLFWEQVRAQPTRTAVVHEKDRLTYLELAERGSDLAIYLQHLGVQLDDCVGLFVEPSLELMVGAWGILFAGAAYLPLSPEYPEDRLRYMITDSRTPVIFTQEKLKPRLAELAPEGTRIVTPSDAAEFARTNARTHTRELESRLGPHNLAYIIYTSGSTGKPKGVMIEHRGITNQMHWLKTAHQLDRSKVVLQKTPMSFDAAQWEILALSCGSKVVMGSPGVYRDPERLIETLSRHQVTTLQCVPTLLQALLDTEAMHQCRSLTQLFSGGEALTKSLSLRCLETLPGASLVNLYGPTECTINSSAFTVDATTLRSGPNTISIGAPVHNTQYYILNRQLEPVPVGELGELYIGGVQLARGYLHQPELTSDRFITNPFAASDGQPRLYKTGDLAYWNPDGTVQFAGRTDNQVKLRGFRVELDEIKVAIETHDWVKNAAVIVKNDPHTGFQNLISFVELNPHEAALMDQGNHGSHHQSKASKLQVKEQLRNPGVRDATQLHGKPVVDLPGRVESPEQRRRVFARKTYRSFEDGPLEKADLLRLLGTRVPAAPPRPLETLSLAEFGELLRYFGQYLSDERLLPKYGYASPGALYATQLHLELNRVKGLVSGHYYYHPQHHQLVLLREKEDKAGVGVKLHFIGRKSAIEPVYKNNIREVLEIETGHMVGLFEQVLPAYGLSIHALAFTPEARDALECTPEDDYLGTFALGPYSRGPEEATELYVQAHPHKVVDLAPGLYRYQEGDLKWVANEVILKKQVIAINQQTYQNASFGITVLSRDAREWLRYIELGRVLQHLQMNDLGLGFMSSGYSSKSGHDLPSARRISAILKTLGEETAPSYFFLGGRISEEQRLSEGMKEDAIHMKGPAELIKQDLIDLLPDYMVPNRIQVLDRLPLTANGKIDFKALEKLDVALVERPFVAPRTPTEERVCALWKKEMKRETASVQDDFFESGGNSLIAVGLINKMNREFRTTLPLQTVFECPTIEKLAQRVDLQQDAPVSRLVRLRAEGTRAPIFCWPGLGGYTMNLRLLASRIRLDQPLYGVQAHGINPGESPFATIKEMAAEDIKLIKQRQPTGPYTLWGYSFGARVAFEAAYQLEQQGERVENLLLIAPGSPKVRESEAAVHGGEPSYDNRAYVTILYSVFAGRITGPALDECLKAVRDEDSFVSFIAGLMKTLDAELVRRIVRVVHQTYEFKYTFRELAERRLQAPITLFKARGDDYAFIENASGYSAKAPAVVNLDADHYSLLKDPDIDELVKMIQYR